MVDLVGKLWLTIGMDAPSISKEQALALYDNNGAALGRALGVTRQYINGLPDGELPERLALKLRFLVKPEAFTVSGQIKQSALKHKAA